MTKLQEQFEDETGLVAYGRGINCKIYSDAYVEWLEEKTVQNETLVNCLWVPIRWINNNPALDGAKYFTSKEAALEFIDSHKIKASNVIEWTIPRIEAGN